MLGENRSGSKKAPNERLADSLQVLSPVLKDGIYRAGQISRRDFSRIFRAGYLAEIMKGWYHVTNPTAPSGVTVWQGHYWPFVQQYLEDRFENQYCLAADPSLLLLAGLTRIPTQIAVLTERADGNRIDLPFGCSLLPYRDRSGLPTRVSIERGLRVMPLDMALARASEGFFRAHSTEAASLLATVRDPSAILRELLDRGATVYAGRIAGAFRNIGYTDFADRIIDTMRDAGYEINESDPFTEKVSILRKDRPRSPYVARIRIMWASMRDTIAESFEAPPGLPHDSTAYLGRIRQLATLDAYHSLSIEGYKVDDILIERVRANAFDPKNIENDRQQKDAFAARGYYEASQAVTRSIEKILAGEESSGVLRTDHHDWYRALFDVAVQAGILHPSELAGYRGHQVYINNSQHVPLPPQAVVDGMECLFDLLAEEPHAAVRAVLGHFIFVFIHPYGDGNGRLGRFLMNALFASGGYPWTVVHLDARNQYMKALERASTDGEIGDFAVFISGQMKRTSLELL